MRSRPQGIKRGDRVIIYMPLVPETVIAMHACNRIGAIHSVVFGGFSAGGAQGPHRGHRGEAGDHRRRRLARRPGRSSSRRRWTRRSAAAAPSVEQRHRAASAPAEPVPMQPGRDLWWHDAHRGPAADLRAGMGGRRAPVVPAVHLGLHRQAEGHSALRPAAICSAPSSPRSGCSTCATTMCSGARRTSAGSPGTATSPTVRSPSARPS